MTVRDQIDLNDFRPIPHWEKPRGGLFRVFVDMWWMVDDDGNPMVWAPANSPQCNAIRSVAERIAGDRQVKQLPIVYMPVRPADFE